MFMPEYLWCIQKLWYVTLNMGDTTFFGQHWWQMSSEQSLFLYNRRLNTLYRTSANGSTVSCCSSALSSTLGCFYSHWYFPLDYSQLWHNNQGRILKQVNMTTGEMCHNFFSGDSQEPDLGCCRRTSVNLLQWWQSHTKCSHTTVHCCCLLVGSPWSHDWMIWRAGKWCRKIAQQSTLRWSLGLQEK